jgi:predicted dehydrogenase
MKGILMTEKIRWGIVSTGWMAQKFAEGLVALPEAEIVAVSSRTKESADKFAIQFQIPRRYTGIEEIANDKDVDIIYIATPHPMHKNETIICLNAGKAVLCEKPFAVNSKEVKEMIACAKKNKLFLMEAMWTYFFPAIIKMQELIAEGAIGEIGLVTVNFCSPRPFEPESRFFNPQLGGGALLDMGVYNIALVYKILGKEPTQIKSIAHIGKTGVDEQSTTILGYENNAMAVLTCSLRVGAINEVVIYGTEGYIKIPSSFWHPDKIILKKGEDAEKEFTFKRLGNGYCYEAVEVMKCLREGKVECPTMPLKTSAAIIKAMDKIRKQWKLVYPMEKKACRKNLSI